MALRDAAADPAHPLDDDLIGRIGYDGRRNAYTAKKLPFEHQLQWTICLPERGSDMSRTDLPRDEGRKFRITFKLVNTIDISVLLRFTEADPAAVRAAGAAFPEAVLNAIQALQIVLSNRPAETLKVHGGAGRRFFDPTMNTPIPSGAEIWRGE